MKFKNILAIGAGVLAIFTALVIVDELAVAEQAYQKSEPQAQPVSVVIVHPERHAPNLTLLGNTQARYVTQLRVSSNGQLSWLDTEAEPGTLVPKSTPLARLDMTHLASELAQAQSRVRHAELALEQQLHEQSVAVRMLSNKNQSRYARKEPQVAAAKADLAHAKLALESTSKLVQEAQIIAPFDAVILSRMVSPGDWLSAGETLFQIASSASIDVIMPVSESTWRKLAPQLASQQITLHVIDRAGTSWPAEVRYIAPNVDVNTRQRQIVLKVANPYSSVVSLMPNQPVQVHIQLAAESNAFKVPQSALTRGGMIWLVDERDTLHKEHVEVLSKNDQHAFIRFNSALKTSRKVVSYPLLTMLVGNKVSPVVAQIRLASKEESQ
ncbi:hypothetical protein N480_21295 [Pseudoalteromonas luteoviolacea S2607]|uniref:efflux RND transporter periplasmic adaptor subunit n=1 Tax=Pseudoalteromonas luteoviolacea TaxID=43657 RepID=UPI0007B06D41|nr:efflux RND transporter periplasmic adaptor subunit [Pseudoalteromonas luteoviolacea]KZN34563.1 hypothetical protein N480_21295 [Pseudoalteromonas luteoviolacea S2607]